MMNLQSLGFINAASLQRLGHFQPEAEPEAPEAEEPTIAEKDQASAGGSGAALGGETPPAEPERSSRAILPSLETAAAADGEAPSALAEEKPRPRQVEERPPWVKSPWDEVAPTPVADASAEAEPSLAAEEGMEAISDILGRAVSAVRPLRPEPEGPSEPLSAGGPLTQVLELRPGQYAEIPFRLRVEMEDSRQLAMLQDLHAQREQLKAELEETQRQIAKLGRTQFKASNVFEAAQKKTEELIADLRASQAAQERQLEAMRDLGEQVRREVRANLARDLLRVVDGLEASLEVAAQIIRGFNVGWADLQPPGFLRRFRRGAAKRVQEFLEDRQEELRSWHEGLQFVYQRLLRLLEEMGVERIEAVGESFDPHYHAAIGTVNDPQQPPNVVVQEQLAGYVLEGQVLRFAEVVVNKPKEEES